MVSEVSAMRLVNKLYLVLHNLTRTWEATLPPRGRKPHRQINGRSHAISPCGAILCSLSLFPTHTYSLRRWRKVEKVKPYGKCQVMAWRAFQSRLLHASRRPIYIDRMRPGCSGRGRRMRLSISSVQPPRPWSPSVCPSPFIMQPDVGRNPHLLLPLSSSTSNLLLLGWKTLCVVQIRARGVYALKLSEH